MNKIAVIGTTFVDIKGFPFSRYDSKGTNPGYIEYVHGGVARNVAENIANLGIKSKLISLVDKTGIGDDIIRRLESHGVDISSVRRTESGGLGTWMAVLDDNHDLAGSISEQPNFDEMLNLVSTEVNKAVEDCNGVVVSIDSTPEITEKAFEIIKKKGIKTYTILGNITGMPDNTSAISDTELFVCNSIEAEQILNMKIDCSCIKEVINACKTGAESLKARFFVITCGSQGSAYYDLRTGLSGKIDIQKTEIIDSTGAGDSFFAGAVAALVSSKSIDEALNYASKIAAMTISSHDNTCPKYYELIE